jgi:hypothetical protein
MFQIFKEKTFFYMMISTKKFNGELGPDIASEDGQEQR